MIKVVFVEDNMVFHKGLKLVLQNSKEIDLVGMYSTAESLINDFEFVAPDVVVMDIDLPGMNGIEAISLLKKNHKATKFLVLTVHENENLIQALKSGADGYLVKKNSFDSIEEEIITLSKGGFPITPDILDELKNYFQNNGSKDTKNNPVFDLLTEKERHVLELVSEGFLNKEIANKINLSIDSVKKITQHIYEKLEVRNRSEAVNKYLSHKG
ncbi:response regulator transcription factor [Flavobacterium sp. 20NA77.7]|uniref:Response regulator transcription factor n=1 Tax=Flavobacterium nakdongensis TaxID=3073563 RepID=A0ABY9R801_9FLAO|nr:response regulator transcription factor [Flavobacterium sp. 20NA77.7]WMW77390.1 response regulator transcription factor [Flavobacterium sp. 20NA77.7]